jgi:hypothetical protein
MRCSSSLKTGSRGQLDPRVANAMGYLASVLLCSSKGARSADLRAPGSFGISYDSHPQHPFYEVKSIFVFPIGQEVQIRTKEYSLI